MIKEAFENKKLPNSLEIATITLFPKPGKNKQKCDSYRPLSLLNADYKVLSKLIAHRLEDIIPKIIHPDQTGFVKNRHASDNVRRLLHMVETAQKNETPMLIISMDANKAFDINEPSFLLRTLEAMGFGEKCIQYIKTLFNAPKANILTNDVLSNTFSLTRGCRQGCPSSPLLFAITISHCSSIQFLHCWNPVQVNTNYPFMLTISCYIYWPTQISTLIIAMSKRIQYSLRI